MEQRKKGKGVVKDKFQNPNSKTQIPKPKFQNPSSKTQVQKAGKIDSGFL
jgi:hypothetical protein